MSQVIFITGGGSGIGKAIAELFANKGYRVVITGRNEEKLNEAVKEIQQLNSNQTIECWPIQLDISNAKAVHECVDKVLEKWNKIDILINNAGLALGSPKPFYEQSIEDIQTVINTNIMGTLMVTHAILQKSMMSNLKGKGKGTIINISSITGLEVPPMGEATYHTSKTAIEGFSNVLRQETLGSNIRILVVRPGFVGGTTNFHGNRLNDKSAEKEVFQGLQPILETDIAQAVEYLVDSPERVSIKAIDVVPTAQRSLAIVDRDWNKRNSIIEN